MDRTSTAIVVRDYRLTDVDALRALFRGADGCGF